MNAEERLASYGTLAPGEENQHQLDELDGRWIEGVVLGKRVKAGWGTWLGFPGFVLDPNGGQVKVHIFESKDLPQHWQRLDDFEGEEYKRVITTADTDEGPLEVCIYEIKRHA